jgi:hypothetical protein
MSLGKGPVVEFLKDVEVRMSAGSRLLIASIFVAAVCVVASAQTVDYRVLATNKTSTMQKELNEAAEAGFQFGGVMGGETSFGGSEVVTIMYRKPSEEKGRFTYKLLATTKTSTMQKELQAAGNEGYEYKGQTVYPSTFGGKEVVTILELDRSLKVRPKYEYKLLATNKTSTMQKELQAAGAEGFEFVGVTVGNTAMGGREVVSILRRIEK